MFDELGAPTWKHHIEFELSHPLRPQGLLEQSKALESHLMQELDPAGIGLSGHDAASGD